MTQEKEEETRKKVPREREKGIKRADRDSEGKQVCRPLGADQSIQVFLSILICKSAPKM